MDSKKSNHVAVESTYLALYSKNFKILYAGTNNLFSVNLGSLYTTLPCMLYQNLATLSFYCSLGYDYRQMKFAVWSLFIK